MIKALVLLACSIAALQAEDTWAKVRELKTGVELRIYKKGSVQPVLAKMDEAGADRLAVIVKDQQVAIPKDQIDRIDYRPAKPGGRVTKQTREETKDGASELARPGPPGSYTGPSTTTSTNYTLQGKPEFETIYRRAPAPPKP